MSQEQRKVKISPVLLFGIGSILFVIHFMLIILTELGLLEYATTKYLIIPIVLLLGFLPLISVILYRKGLIKQISHRDDRKYLLASMLLFILPAIAFLLLLL